MFVRDYGDCKTTSYPELESKMGEILGELGKVTVGPHPVFTLPEYASWTVTIDFPQPPVVRDWAKGALIGGLFMNIAGGGIGGVYSIARVGSVPRPGDTSITFYFELTLNSRYIPLSEHSEAKVIEQLHRFVDMAKVGFCYHFREIN